MEIFTNTIIQLAIVIAIFLVLTVIGTFIYTKLKNKIKTSKDIGKILPQEEIQTLR